MFLYQPRKGKLGIHLRETQMQECAYQVILKPLYTYLIAETPNSPYEVQQHPTQTETSPAKHLSRINPSVQQPLSQAVFQLAQRIIFTNQKKSLMAQISHTYTTPKSF